jgi:DNA polymerase-3 subunit alpha
VCDPDEHINLDLVSRQIKISVGRELISFLKEKPELSFRIN